MEDQGKRLLLTVGIVALMYLAWTTFFAPTPPAQQAQAPQPQVVQQPQAPSAPGPAAGATAASEPSAAPAAPVAACDPTKEEEPARWDTPDYVATFSRCGGALSSFQIKGSQYRVEGNQIDLVHDHANPARFPLQVQVDMPPAGSTNPDDKRLPAIPDNAEWQRLTATATEVSFRWTAPDGGVQVTKAFRRPEQGRFAIGLDFEVKNTSAK